MNWLKALIRTWHYKFKVWLVYPWTGSEEPKKTLCLIQFTYDLKGVMGGRNGLTESVYAWVEENCDTRDCVPLFNPKGVKKEHCRITNVQVDVVGTVKPFKA